MTANDERQVEIAEAEPGELRSEEEADITIELDVPTEEENPIPDNGTQEGLNNLKEELDQMDLKSLRKLYNKEFNVQTRIKSKEKLVAKLVEKLATKKDGEPDEEGITVAEAIELLRTARAAYVRIGSVEEERKSRMSALREQLKTHKTTIDEAFKSDDEKDSNVKLAKLEAAWGFLRKVEQAQAEARSEYSSMVKDAKQSLKDAMTAIRLRQQSFNFED